MKERDEKIPTIKELEKEVGEFLSKKFGGQVKLAGPIVMPGVSPSEEKDAPNKKKKIEFDLKPEELIAYLDQYIVKQDNAKAILATKICTHFNRIKTSPGKPDEKPNMVGKIKNNVLMIGPTGVGKTYMIKLIAKKIGVPFVKGDATKFSETGYVGGDVEDLVRDLVREADDDIEAAQFGIIYIDEIDKIASSKNHIGADVSRTGVQRALLKPMEETEVDMKVPHDPISMIQEIEHFRKTGKRNKNSINTKNILFIMSGAFSDLPEIIGKRLKAQQIGFGAKIESAKSSDDLLAQVTSEDLITYGFESEFVGRLPIRAVFETLMESDLYEILKNPNNPIILGKKLDFSAYGIQAKFSDGALRLLAERAYNENTGARGLVSTIEKALLPFERRLPSTDIKYLPITKEVILNPESALKEMMNPVNSGLIKVRFDRLVESEKKMIREYISKNRNRLSEKVNFTLTDLRVKIIADYYSRNITDVSSSMVKVKSLYDEVKNIEVLFFKNHDINIVLEDGAVDFIIEAFVNSDANFMDFQHLLDNNLQYGLNLVKERTGKRRFFITREAFSDPEEFIKNLIKEETGQK